MDLVGLWPQIGAMLSLHRPGHEREIRFQHINNQQFLALLAQVRRRRACLAPSGRCEYWREESLVELTELPAAGSAPAGCFSPGCSAPAGCSGPADSSSPGPSGPAGPVPRKRSFRRVFHTNGSYRLEHKDVVQSLQVDDWDLRVSLAAETPVLDLRVAYDVARVDARRWRNRRSFNDLDPASALFGFRLDMTIVSATAGGCEHVKYEVELELIHAFASVASIERAIQQVYGWLHSAPTADHILPMWLQRDTISRMGQLMIPSLIMPLRELPLTVLNKPRCLPGGPIGVAHAGASGGLGGATPCAPAALPVGSYLFTPKYDGVRALMLITGPMALLYLWSNDVLRLGDATPILIAEPQAFDTILDGEWLVHEDRAGGTTRAEFHSFDLLFFGGRDLRRANFATRHHFLDRIAETSYHRRKPYYATLGEAFGAYDRLAGPGAGRAGPTAFGPAGSEVVGALSASRSPEPATPTEPRKQARMSPEGPAAAPAEGPAAAPPEGPSSSAPPGGPSSELPAPHSPLPAAPSAPPALPVAPPTPPTLPAGHSVRPARPFSWPVDGLILQPVEQPYYNELTFKWKPAEQMTIDFQLHRIGPELFAVLVYTSGRLYEFRGSVAHPCLSTIHVPGDLFQDQSPHERIVECRYGAAPAQLVPPGGEAEPARPAAARSESVESAVALLSSLPSSAPPDSMDPVAGSSSASSRPASIGGFVPVRYRIDRSQPNSADVALSIYESIITGPIAREELIRLFSPRTDS